MKRKFLTVLLMSAIVLAGSTVAKADDVFDSNTEKSSEIDRNTKKQPEANPEDTISTLKKIVEEESEKEKNAEDIIDTYADSIAIDEGHFPDENFRKYLKDNFDKNADGYFSQDEIDNVTSIDVSGNSTIKSLTGINYFTSLTDLDCSKAGLTELDVHGNPNLQTLDCGSNQLIALDVSRNSNLKELNCGANQLTTLNINTNPTLQELICSNNQLKTLDVSGSEKLRILWCNLNQLTDVDVSQNPELVQLLCGNNQLRELDINNNKKLDTLV